MQVIFKYEVTDAMMFSIIEAPIIKILKVDYQNGVPYLWAIVDTELRTNKYRIYRIGTGHPFGSDTPIGSINPNNYINTTVMSNEPYVWHWFYDKVE